MSRKNLQHITLNTVEGPTLNSGIFESDFEFGAGFAPFLRGISSTMYIRLPWDILQSVEFNSINDYNSFYKRSIKAGQHHFSLNFNCNRDKSSLVETLEQFKSVFKDIPLNDIKISFKDDVYLLANLAFYIVTAETLGIELKNLNGTFEIDALKELNLLTSSNTSKKIFSDVLKFTKTDLLNFSSISIYSDPLQSLNVETELALMLISGQNQLKKGIDSGLKIDDIAPRLSFSFEIGLNHFSEISKLRVARFLWAKIVKSYLPKNEKSLALHIQCKANSSNSNSLETENGVTKATVGALASVFGGTQRLYTQTTTPSSFKSERLDKNIQLYLQAETQITKTVDPWAGSIYVEKQTKELARKTWSIFKTFETSGKFPEDIQSEIFRFKPHALEVKNLIENINPSISDRDEATVSNSLLKITEATRNEEKNILTLAINAVKCKATFSEICQAVN